MSTMTAPAPTVGFTPIDPDAISPGAYGCDRADCPAPATHRVEVLAQDFYFCGHHWREMVGPLSTAGARTTRWVPAT